MSVSGEYIVHDCLPEYSLALHIIINDDKKISSYDIDVLEGVEDDSKYLTVKKADIIPKEIQTRILGV